MPLTATRAKPSGKGDKLLTISLHGAAIQRRGWATMADETYTFVCTVCGWEYTSDSPELPEDFVCEVCGVGPEMFELVEE